MPENSTAQEDDFREDILYGLMLDLRLHILAKLERDWVSGPYAGDKVHARENAARAAQAVARIVDYLNDYANGDHHV